MAGKPLPGFQVLTLQGEARSSAQLAPHEQWLLLYVHPEPEDLHEHFNTVEAPLNALGEQELCPGSAALDKINASLR